jgi:hypothetical protein
LPRQFQEIANVIPVQRIPVSEIFSEILHTQCRCFDISDLFCTN